VIHVSAVVIRDDRGRVLTVRKRGTSRFMFPGGKPEPGETSLDAAVRECAEELGIELDPLALRRLGTFQAAAANEQAHVVEAVVFVHEPVSAADVAPTAEIDALRWLDTSEVPLPADLAPLLVDHVIPALEP
jgi:8-oxo-dGTP diphosphatase